MIYSSVSSNSYMDDDEEINQLRISINNCDNCSINSRSMTAMSDLTSDSTSSSVSNSPGSVKSPDSPGRVKSPDSPGSVKSSGSVKSCSSIKSENSRSSKTLDSIRESIESGDSITPEQEACIFMIETMLDVFPEGEGFFVNDDYNETHNIDYIEFFVFNNNVKEGEEGELCLNFYFDATIMYIERAFTSKCANITGNDLLNRMKEVFIRLKEKFPESTMKIRLDESKIEFFKEEKKEEIWLKWLYLFKSGETWYNSKGYKENNYDENKRLMDEFISQPISQVYDNASKILETLRIPELEQESETIQTLFIKVCEILKTEEGKQNCCEYIELLNITIEKFKNFLKTRSPNNFMRTKFYELWFSPLKEEFGKGGRKTRKRRSIKKKNNRSIKRKNTKKSMKRRKGKKTMKRRTKKHKK